MQRLQVHVAVKDFAQSARFSVPLFAAMPIVVKDDYAKQIPLDRLRCRRLPLDGPVPAPAAFLRRPHLPPRARRRGAPSEHDPAGPLQPYRRGARPLGDLRHPNRDRQHP
jgi:hypothetical protein